jgi:pimeloyl-ACP methyl ester carboxylesterase
MGRTSVDIGEGIVLEAIVMGSGPATVIFENGLGTPLEEWDAIAPHVAQRARTLRYDRRAAAPTGAAVGRTAAEMATDLERLLAALDLKPPYVLVGHSWGGVVARTFTHRHVSAMSGLVLVDATHEVIDSAGLALLPAMYMVMGVAARFDVGRRWLRRQLCPPAASAAYHARFESRLADPSLWSLALRTARAEGAGIRPSLAAVRRDCPDLPRLPVHVLTAGGVTGPNLKSVRRVHEAWRAAVARAPYATYTNVPDSGHLMPIDAPDVVVHAVLGIIDSAS